MAETFNPELVKNLPDAYNKAADSNNAKILEIERSASSELRETLAQIYDSLDIDKATGKTLDLYGEMLVQKRGLASDSVYRALLKNRIVRNLARGDYHSILNALSVVFNCAPSEFQLVEDLNAVSVKITDIPFESINKSGLTADEAVAIVRKLIPAAVTLEALEFGGTFEFSDSEMEYDEEKGFGDVEQTVGGYLGLAANGSETELPI